MKEKGKEEDERKRTAAVKPPGEKNPLREQRRRRVHEEEKENEERKTREAEQTKTKSEEEVTVAWPLTGLSASPSSEGGGRGR